MSAAKILYVIDAYRVGGGERFLAGLVNRGLKKKKFTEWICTLRDPGYLEQLESSGVPVVSLLQWRGPNYGSTMPKWRKVSQGLPLLVALPRLIQLIKNNDFQIVVAIGYPASLITALASVIVKRPNYIYRCSYLRSSLLPFEKRLMSWLLSRYQKIVCISEAVRQSFLSQFPWLKRRTIVIYNGIDSQLIEASISERSKRVAELRDQLHLSPYDMIFINVARFVPEKAHQLLIQAFQSVQKSTAAHLVLVGDGPLREIVERNVSTLQIRQYVHFLGHMEKPLNVLVAADIFVFSSLSEGFGIALIEAMSVGLPVVAFDIPAVREIVEQNVTGLLVPEGDVMALADAMLTIARDRTLRERLGQRAAKTVRERFTLDMARKRYENLYRELLEDH